MTKPRVEPSVSEPARSVTCNCVHTQSAPPICAVCNKPVAVIAPQPTPPTQTCSECSLVFGEKHHLVHCASATCPILDRLIAEVAPQPTPEPALEKKRCPIHHPECPYAQVTAPQGVGKLSPEPPSSATCNCVHTQSAPPICAVCNKPVTLIPKGVDGVGQTARELEVWQFWDEYVRQTDIEEDNDRLRSWAVPFAEAWAAREALTLRAELQQATQELKTIETRRKVALAGFAHVGEGECQCPICRRDFDALLEAAFDYEYRWWKAHRAENAWKARSDMFEEAKEQAEAENAELRSRLQKAEKK